MKELTTILNQTEFAKLVDKEKQTINRFVKRKDCPFDTVIISGVEFIELTERTNKWVENNKK